MSGLNVLVVGASIAGPTAAYWFAKAGANVTIIERFPKLRTNGQGIDIRTAGVTVMRKMPRMEAAVRAKLSQLEGLSFVRENGTPFATLKATGDPNQQSLVSEYEIFRGDLAQILFDLTKDNERIKYVFGEQISSMQQKDDEPVTVEFANGLRTAKYDLVVACDGATSRTRAMALGCDIREHMRPVNTWAAYFSVEQDLLEGSKMGHAFSTIEGRFLALGPGPSGLNQVTLMAVRPRNDRDYTLPFREASKQGVGALKQYVFQYFDGAGWKADEILKGMMKSEDFYASEWVQVKVPSVYRGRVALVGDAGYAPGPTGHGTSLAIAGAYVLAGEVGRHKNDLAAGLRSYEERMRPIINDMQKIPPGIPGIMAPQTAWGIWLRNTLFIFVAWCMAFSSLFAWISKFFASYFASAFGSDKYGLPDYEWVA
ncbi:hypothetical protein IMSHALPRED_010985 [Imshaugia aleurites]|uniref:FAD-binding domain-containing protein n=1 Tax=Imshaugia aleurites TaxID=172621 RepID=A0A8H3IWV5_9LECA|nr:hypothetical protein IMSHALPRED_010985 [Imshaugia aleurites]